MDLNANDLIADLRSARDRMQDAITAMQSRDARVSFILTNACTPEEQLIGVAEAVELVANKIQMKSL